MGLIGTRGRRTVVLWEGFNGTYCGAVGRESGNLGWAGLGGGGGGGGLLDGERDR